MKAENEEYSEVWTYIVAASKSADEITCGVPFKINEDYIFFGPCMKNYRRSLYEQYLKNEKIGRKDIDEHIYFLGISGSKVKNAKRDEIRKILWFGKLLSVFTFEYMHTFIDSLEDKKEKTDFEEMRACDKSPLHILPVIKNDMFIGYKSRETYHKNKWFEDFTSEKSKLKIFNGKRIELKNPEERFDIFDKDCCLLFNNIFYAEGQGIEIDNETLNIFKEHPKLSSRADTITNPYFIYGKAGASDKAIGLQGNGLKFKGRLSKKLINCLMRKIQSLEKVTHPETKIHTFDSCR